MHQAIQLLKEMVQKGEDYKYERSRTYAALAELLSINASLSPVSSQRNKYSPVLLAIALLISVSIFLSIIIFQKIKYNELSEQLTHLVEKGKIMRLKSLDECPNCNERL